MLNFCQVAALFSAFSAATVLAIAHYENRLQRKANIAARAMVASSQSTQWVQKEVKQ